MSMTTTKLDAESFDKRLIWVMAVTIILGFSFWSGSRYPDLGEKASMAGELELRGISFDVPYPVNPRDPMWKQIRDETGNWIITNKKGMMFGLAFATCLMTFFSLLPNRGPKSGFGNALIGTVIGSPLGVCVNCATPIAKGTYLAGSRMELSLALLLSSPTLNIIVLTMMISLLPWYMVATKLLLSMAIILVGIPVICRLWASDAKRDVEITDEQAVPTNFFKLNPGDPSCQLPTANTWSRSLLWAIKDLARNGWRICLITVPMMLLAGFLGAVVTTLLPWEMLINQLPTGSVPLILIAMVGVALLGTFLPVPMSFDVIIVAILLTAGMPVHYVMVLFFTLGLFSIYPFLVIDRKISRKVARALFGVVAAAGVIGGIIVHYADDWWNTRHLNNVIGELRQLPPATPNPSMESTQPMQDATTIRSWMTYAQPESLLLGLDEEHSVRVEQYALAKRDQTADGGFTKISGPELGMEVPAWWFVGEYLYFLDNNRCIASGDIHQDGWPDIVVGGDNGLGGIYVFANREGKRFERQKLDLGSLNNETISYVALVDLNNDGWLDLFFSTFNQGNYVVYNQEGFFDSAVPEPLPSPRRAHTMTAAFADPDRNGELEMVLGNWALGPLAGVRGRTSKMADNLYVEKIDGTYQAKKMPAFPGETLSILFSDLNQDDWIDLLVGNDFGPADVIYLNAPGQGWTQVKAADDLVPHTTASTMSIASADIDNDLTPEIYFAQIAMGPDRRKFHRKSLLESEIINEAPDIDPSIFKAEITSRDLFRKVRQKPAESKALLDQAKDNNERRDLVALVAAQMRKTTETRRLSKEVPDHMIDLQRIFDRNKAGSYGRKYQRRFDPIKQHKGTNVLLKKNDSGNYEDLAGELGIAIAGWAWNSKFADLDLDGWQDLYVANGFETSKFRESNFYFRNQGGRKFTDETAAAGLTDHFTTGAYTYCDIDQDGDLDIVSVPNSAPIRVWRNNQATGHAIVVELRDEIGNRYGIGSKVYIYYGDGLHQMREIQASGGFHSAEAPLAHFGLGEHKSIDRLEIHWSTGEKTIRQQPLVSDKRYVVHRLDNPTMTATNK